MSRTPNEIGNDAEDRAAAILGGRRIGGSGGGRFLKLDVKDGGSFIYSIKATTKLREAWLRAMMKLWNEAVSGARGAAGHGDSAKPAMIFEIEGEMYLWCRLEDHAEIATGVAEPYIRPSKADERRQRINRSGMGS